ncbi:MAG: gliding motility protein RemB, partial [Flavobacterium sp.]|nr:gliding motility protein RemB [Flavobacterium sp.]
MNKILKIVCLLLPLFFFAQNANETLEQHPVFPNCEGKSNKELEQCFNAELQKVVYGTFQVPENLKESNFKGIVTVLFEVNQEGKFIVQYVDAIHSELVAESKRVFNDMSLIGPPTYAGKPTYSRYTIKITIPLEGFEPDANQEPALVMSNSKKVIDSKKELTEFDDIKYTTFSNPQFKSNLNIPFSHNLYSQFDSQMNQVGANNHTA